METPPTMALVYTSLNGKSSSPALLDCIRVGASSVGDKSTLGLQIHASIYSTISVGASSVGDKSTLGLQTHASIYSATTTRGANAIGAASEVEVRSTVRTAGKKPIKD
ncbi:hypothetical protein GN958_ATG16627 [Phytophthora infestans]|uniref:Uncharacterized protein n=1 Tax=Phytophthora infestans TaxID=4787 RepID=A0A8S9U3C2_PHYIN|nr:hypothetical protein GN958_ATG16627 [Phytophthora infestans]